MKTLCFIVMFVYSVFAFERTQVHMGTLIRVQCDDSNLTDSVFDLFGKLDSLLSTYKADSEISRLNRSEPIALSAMTRQILERSVEMNLLSSSAFDVTIGSVTHDAYRFGTQKERLPNSHQIRQALQSVGAARIHITSDRIWTEPGTVIDLGGIGKGYAVDKAIELLEDEKIKRGVVAASGDIGCLGECRVDIQNPFHPDGVIATIRSSLPRFAVSTSGNYERYIKNKTHNHLINPKNGKSEQRYASITLMDNGDNTRIDALATAVSVMDEEEAITMLERLHIAYLLIKNDGTIIQNTKLEGVEVIMKDDTFARYSIFSVGR